VDFLVTVDRKPWFCVETKLSERADKNSLSYFRKSLNIPYAYLVVKESGVDKFTDGYRIISADSFCSSLV